MTDPFALLEATWPPAQRETRGPITRRDGAGGGKRVSAATVEGAWTPGELDEAIAAGERLFMVRPGQETLDAALAERGFEVVDPTVIYAAEAAALAGDLPRASVYTLDRPLKIVEDMWAAAGIGPERLAVMARAPGPKTYLLGRAGQTPGAVAFVACHGEAAMLHALEVPPAVRRHGQGGRAMRAAANWALETGARTLSLAVTRANTPANALYLSLGMAPVAHYHYRQRMPKEA